MACSATSSSKRDRDEAAGVVGKEKAKEEQNDMSEGLGDNGGQNGEKVRGTKDRMISAVAKSWKKLDLDLPTALMMMKAALPPTIALAMYQSTDVAQTYTTLGYLVAIVSILGFCIMPRAKFVQTMILNIIFICLGSAVSLLELWSSVKAREHTTPAGISPASFQYSSSQSAVLAVWLFFQIWLVNTVKAKFPQFASPTLLYAIFVNVASTDGLQYQTMAQVKSLVQRLLEAFLTGFAIATGVSLLIIPVSCRKVVTKEITEYIGALRGALDAHRNYFQNSKQKGMLRQTTCTPAPNKKEEEKIQKPDMRWKVEAVRKMTDAFTELHGKLNADLPFAKREIAYGKLTPRDYESIFKHLRAIMMPMVGLGSLIDLIERVAGIHRWGGENTEDSNAEMYQKKLNDWNNLMKFVYKPFLMMIEVMDQGLEHVLIRLQLIKQKKKKGMDDTEAVGNMVRPGDKDFVEYLEEQSDEFSRGRETTLRHWLEIKGIKLRTDFFENPTTDPEMLDLRRIPTCQRNERQLYIVLYIVFLLHSVSRAILAFVKFADEKDQAAAKNKFIVPSKRRVKKWITSIFKSQDFNQEDEITIASSERNNTIVYMGEAYNSKKDPEHLPPKNAWEKFGNLVRATADFLESPESSFGFRCACATMSIAIIAFLHQTQIWFIKQRLIWAMIMVALSMTPTAGQSVFTFLLRIIGTVIAMVIAWLIWYIPDQKTPGVIVLFWVFVSLQFYVPLKRPNLTIVGVISVVTVTVIVGYELEVRKIGVAVATSNGQGQPYYPIYELGPYRLATVAGGLAVAFIWTFFPFPITEHYVLRQKLGGALYLSANFYSITHETVMARIRGDEGDLTDKTSPGFKLEKARHKVFAKQILTLQSLKLHSAMANWEFPLGGKFPKKEYNAIIGYVTNIVNCTALLGYASDTFTHLSLIGDETDPSSIPWFHDFRRIILSSNITSHEITSLLVLLSSSITDGRSLPPYLTAPQAFQLARHLDAIDRDILSISHITEPGYAAFAVLQTSARCIQVDIEKLLNTVKGLIGELDFSFHIVSTQTSSKTSSSDPLAKTSSQRSKQD